MRLTTFFITALAFSSASASWFGSDKPEYTTWDTKQLKKWLNDHDIQVPEGYTQKELQELVKTNYDTSAAWSQAQYEKAQKAFQNAKESTFDSWDESRLREFLLEQGVVAPSGPREKLVLAAKQQYRSYTSAASSMSSSASAAASTAVYGDKKYQASKSASSLTSSAASVAAQATETLARTLDNSKDYVYSTWDDNKLRSYLEDKGVIKTKQQATRDQLLNYMKETYASVSEPVWTAWSDSYIHEWLVAHGLVKSDYEKRRDALVGKMQSYYYGPRDTVWSTWSESELKDWLVKHDIVKSDAQIQKEKMQKLVADNYNNAVDTVWGPWRDADIKGWLVERGYLRSDAEVQRDELVKLMNQKYNEAGARSAAYLTWPDARLRAFLRNHNMSESALPTSRPGLLQETRIRYVQTSSRVEQLYAKIRDTINSGVEIAEEKLGQVLEILSGTNDEAHKKAKSAASAGAKSTDKASASASSLASSISAEAAKASKKAKSEL
ncbi:hypothetical protein BD410DRAFT_782959 [Rickenella mellea]|uniref:Uncharacterized protein n=1 Tax=Rickenella mellea TaxID=50990 RepID=A0A4Y7QIY9_9AGAM|nr:hypothetical protein BD410DRAFT_782959 [Rickenella mellea]